jgi:ribosomal protein L16/L10AE
MLYWVCVDNRPVDLPTRDIEAAKRLALEHMTSDLAAHVQIDVYPGDSAPSRKLRYDPSEEIWVNSDALEP